MEHALVWRAQGLFQLKKSSPGTSRPSAVKMPARTQLIIEGLPVCLLGAKFLLQMLLLASLIASPTTFDNIHPLLDVRQHTRHILICEPAHDFDEDNSLRCRSRRERTSRRVSSKVLPAEGMNVASCSFTFHCQAMGDTAATRQWLSFNARDQHRVPT